MTHPTLSELYNNISKHSNYQVLARPLQALLPQESLNIVSRYELERLAFIEQHQPFAGKVVADVGGNTGFFTLEAAAHGARQVLYFEGNTVHAAFVTEAARQLEMQDIIKASTGYLNFDGDFDLDADICLLLNVLHHVGDDYGDLTLSRDNAKKQILASLSSLASKTDIMVFQLGFNWKGDRRLPLFEHGTKAELIEYVRQGSATAWDILAIGIAVRADDGIHYQELNEANISRDDSMGEFLNRPLFILRSKRNLESTAPTA